MGFNFASYFVLGFLLLCIILGVFAVRKKHLFILALRNLTRKKTSTLFVVIGSMVGAALISGALIINDSFAASSQRFVDEKLGETSGIIYPREVSETWSLQEANEVYSKVNTDFNKFLPIYFQRLTVVNRADNVTRNDVVVMSFDRDTAASYQTTFTDAAKRLQISKEEVIISRTLSQELRAQTGDEVQISLTNNISLVLRIKDIVDDNGLIGFNAPVQTHLGFSPGSVYISPELLPSLVSSFQSTPPAIASGPVYNAILVSRNYNYQRDALANAVQLKLNEYDPNILFEELYEYLASATRGSSNGINFSQILLVVSVFAIIAGLVLMVNLYYMIAEERRSELGTLRALGETKSGIMQAILFEGALYSILSSLLGTIIGIGIGWLFVSIIARIVASNSYEYELQNSIFLAVDAATLLFAFTGACMVSLMVTFLASFRIANISIANAVKDLPNAQKTGINWGNVILVMTLALSGLVLFFVAFWSSALPSNYKAYAMYFGILLFAWPAAYLWYKLRKTYVAFQVAAVGLIILTLLVTRIDFFERAWRNGPFLFVLNALVLLLCFTVLFVLSMERITRVILKVFSFLPRFSSQATIALRYPVEKKFRSTLTILVFALVIFIVTVVSVLRLQVNEVLNTSRSEFHIVIYDQLGREDVIARLDKEKYRLSEIKSIFKTDVGAITLPQYQYQNLPSFDPEAPLGVKPEDEYRDSVVTFGDNFFTSGVKIQSDKSVEEIKKLLTTTNTYVLLGKNYSRAADDLNLRPDIKPGETIQLKFPGNKSIERTVIGIVEDDNSPTVGVLETAVSSSGNSGVLLSETDYQHLRSTEKIYLAGVYGVQLQNPDDAERAGKAFREAFRGSNISSIYSVAEALTRSTQFINQLITLVQGFMALGLIVGVAGLAVVIIRSIHDRKVVIGTLRVLGYSPRMITTLFLTETVLLTVMGILIGFVSGVFASYLFYQYQLVGRTDLPLIIPYSELLWIFAAVTAASLIFSYLPARKAAKLPPVRAIQYIG